MPNLLKFGAAIAAVPDLHLPEKPDPDDVGVSARHIVCATEFQTKLNAAYARTIVVAQDVQTLY
ncbi:MAG: hypothetical protein EBU88_16415, partial [Acidobacteria bacterium]|nr:hypothetical protein [Acidobacteriota bacterium]